VNWGGAQIQLRDLGQVAELLTELQAAGAFHRLTFMITPERGALNPWRVAVDPVEPVPACMLEEVRP
jgi:hypothetical protein